MSFYYYSASCYRGTEDVLYLAHRGAVEGTLQSCFVNVAATDLSELFGVELALAPGFYGEMHQGCLP